MSEFESKTHGSGVKAVLGLKSKYLENTKKELAEIIYQFSVLHERWSVEHRQVAGREVEFAQILSEFSKRVELIAELAAEIQKNIQTTTAQTVTMVDDWLSKEVIEEFNKGIAALQLELSKTIYHASDLLGRYKQITKREQFNAWIKVIGVGVLVGALVGFGTAWLYKPAEPIQSLSKGK